MKKHIIIIGPPRSGKTTLVRMFMDLGYSYLSLDNITSAYVGATSMHKNYLSIEEREKQLEIPKNMIRYYLEEVNRYEQDIKYVVDFNIYHKNLLEYFVKECETIFLVYPKLTEEELFKRIRECDTENDWTYIESDISLKMYCEYFIDVSNKMLEFAKKNNCKYFDVSYNRDQLLVDFFNEIKDNY